jgi:hypothetical protein
VIPIGIKQGLYDLIKTWIEINQNDRSIDLFFVVFRARQAMPLRFLEPGSVGAWHAVPKTLIRYRLGFQGWVRRSQRVFGQSVGDRLKRPHRVIMPPK